MSAWESILRLVNTTLKTVDKGQAFTIDAVGSNSLVVIPVGSYPHVISRSSMERAFAMYLEKPSLTRAEIQKALPGVRTSSYILPICQALAKTRR